jgi:hypothetical protein
MRKGMNIRRILYFLLIESSEMLYLEAMILRFERAIASLRALA